MSDAIIRSSNLPTKDNATAQGTLVHEKFLLVPKSESTLDEGMTSQDGFDPDKDTDQSYGRDSPQDDHFHLSVNNLPVQEVDENGSTGGRPRKRKLISAKDFNRKKINIAEGSAQKAVSNSSNRQNDTF